MKKSDHLVNQSFLKICTHEIQSNTQTLCGVKVKRLLPTQICCQFLNTIYRYFNVLFGYQTIPTEIASPHHILFTQIGNKTEEDFGKFLRKRYTKLIGLFGSRHKVQVESGGDSRVANSAAKGSKGLFPVTSLLKDKTTHVIPKQHDYFLKPSFECRRFVQLYDQYNLSPQIQSQLQQITPFRKYVESYSQTPLEKTMDFYKFYDSLMIESKRGLK